MIRQFLELCPPGCTILDAACGTGKYWQLILASGRAVFGVDQSQGMLSRAVEKHPNTPVAKVGLQELAYVEEFPAAMCIDAMENIFPEDWPIVLRNLNRVLTPGGCLYITVELPMEHEVENAFITAQRLGFPVVYGEWAIEDGYHYYPEIPQVKAWLAGAGFTLAAEAQGDEYLHLILLKSNHSLAALTQAYQDFYACVLAVPESLFLVPMNGWSVRDVVAHLIGWNGGMVIAAEAILRGETPQYYADASNDYQNINAAYVECYTSQSREELLGELDASMQVFQRFILSLDDAELLSSHGVVHYSGHPATAAGIIRSLTGDYALHRLQISGWLLSRGDPTSQSSTAP
jgi:SAM-dependent methyltransferase